MSMPTARPAEPEERVDLINGSRVKVCGITESNEIDVLGGNHVDFVGLWFAVPGGPADLPLDEWRALAGAGDRDGRP